MCNLSKSDEAMLWHKRLRHVSIPKIYKIIGAKVGLGIPLLKNNSEKVCTECPVGKQIKASHKSTGQYYPNHVLELMHLDLMGSMQVESFGGKRYAFVVANDFSRYTWVKFVREILDTYEVFQSLCLRLQKEQYKVVYKIKSDHGREFENSAFNEFCHNEGIFS